MAEQRDSEDNKRTSDWRMEWSSSALIFDILSHRTINVDLNANWEQHVTVKHTHKGAEMC